MSFFSWISSWRYGQSNLSNRYGTQETYSSAIVDDVASTGVDSALQISAVWRSVEIISGIISTLPIMVYRSRSGSRTVDRESPLWSLLHDTPNSLMTSNEFWAVMIVNSLLKGNSYAYLERDFDGNVFSMMPMPSEQVEYRRFKDGTEYYLFYDGNDIIKLNTDNVLHIKQMGNGVTGFSRLDYMRASVGETINAQRSANKMFSNGGKPTGFLMVDGVLKPEHRKQLEESFNEMVSGSASRMRVLDSLMKFEQISLTPEDVQLLSTRQFSVQEIGRWFGVPAILLNQTEGTTTLGSSSNDIIETFYKLTIRPAIVNIEQALKKRVLTAKQRAKFEIEFNMDALLRSSLKDRMEIYSKAVQNGIFNRNECRQLENSEPFQGGEIYTAQSNLLPIDKLGVANVGVSQNGISKPVSQ
jgi:HK97 family phage portal protein